MLVFNIYFTVIIIFIIIIIYIIYIIRIIFSIIIVLLHDVMGSWFYWRIRYFKFETVQNRKGCFLLNKMALYLRQGMVCGVT